VVQYDGTNDILEGLRTPGASWLVMKGADEDEVRRGDDHQCGEGSKRKFVLAWRERKECKENK
jgi:hypothetical protein